ncbi:hypothetical protein [Streptomyces cinereoruber]|uniref:hypothetical protein n=1 Tax=Streptomyces cinereoruber TaxID=67260 RepID=UPI003663E02E
MDDGVGDQFGDDQKQIVDLLLIQPPGFQDGLGGVAGGGRGQRAVLERQTENALTGPGGPRYGRLGAGGEEGGGRHRDHCLSSGAGSRASLSAASITPLWSTKTLSRQYPNMKKSGIGFEDRVSAGLCRTH